MAADAEKTCKADEQRNEPKQRKRVVLRKRVGLINPQSSFVH